MQSFKNLLRKLWEKIVFWWCKVDISYGAFFLDVVWIPWTEYHGAGCSEIRNVGNKDGVISLNWSPLDHQAICPDRRNRLHSHNSCAALRFKTLANCIILMIKSETQKVTNISKMYISTLKYFYVWMRTQCPYRIPPCVK